MNKGRLEKTDAGNRAGQASSRRGAPVFASLPQTLLAGRLAGEILDAIRQLRRNPAAYLRVAFLPDSINGWLPVRLAGRLRDNIIALSARPREFVAGLLSTERLTLLGLNTSTLGSAAYVDGVFIASAVSAEPIVSKRRRRFLPVLATSASVHLVLVGYMIYLALLSPYMDFRVVSKPYEQLGPEVLAPLANPERRMRAAAAQPLSLEEIAERDRKRREEAARRERERAEREKAEREKAERERAEREKAEKDKLAAEQAKAEEKPADDKASQPQFREINDAPIKDIVGKVYALYQAGELDLQEVKFTVMVGFGIAKDGSIPRSSIKILKKSGSDVIDNKAREILWNIGESRALGPISSLTSNSIQLTVNDRITQLTITGFAPNADDAKAKAQMLNLLFWGMRMTQKGTDTAELLSLIKIKSMNNRIDADLTISRARASEMMRARFGASVPQ